MGSYPCSVRYFPGLEPSPERPLSGCVTSEGMCVGRTGWDAEVRWGMSGEALAKMATGAATFLSITGLPVSFCFPTVTSTSKTSS